MLSNILIAWSLTALCVIVHAMGMTALLRWLKNSVERMAAHFWFSTWMLIRTAGWIILLHVIEISIWALFYTWKHAMPDFQSSLYFSAITYTTTGYGDLLLPNEWRLIGGIEPLTGILMCGWSAAFFFAVVSRIYQTRVKPGQT